VHTGITVITVLAVETGLTNRLLSWQIIAHNLKKGGWSLGWMSAVDSQERTIWIVDAHRDGKRFIVQADEELTAFVGLKSAIGTLA